jgi:hypothetical protein
MSRSHYKRSDVSIFDQNNQLLYVFRIVFINNYAFTADLESKIKTQLLQEMKDGTRIISTKPYASLDPNRTLTDRQMSGWWWYIFVNIL